MDKLMIDSCLIHRMDMISQHNQRTYRCRFCCPWSITSTKSSQSTDVIHPPTRNNKQGSSCMIIRLSHHDLIDLIRIGYSLRIFDKMCIYEPYHVNTHKSQKHANQKEFHTKVLKKTKYVISTLYPIYWVLFVSTGSTKKFLNQMVFELEGFVLLCLSCIYDIVSLNNF